MKALYQYIKNLPLYVKVIGIILLILYLSFHIIFFRAPAEFPVDSLINIETGDTLNEISNDLYENSIIRSQFFFKVFVVLLGGPSGVQKGDYYFKDKSNLISTTYRLTQGKFGLEYIAVLIPEGFTSLDISRRLKDALPDFDSDRFISLAKHKEGYLFPDTYLFLPNVNPHTVIKEMEENFKEKTSDLEITEDIIIMASILEREARQLETKKMISGILWNRIDIDMALQVDAVFGYIKGIATFSPTFDDLEIDSPYNTYKYAGLPPGSISNPGLDSIIAALEPIPSEYLFYLTDKEGRMHYSETFDQHVKKKRLYLK